MQKTKLAAALATLVLVITGLVASAPTAAAATDGFYWPVSGSVPYADVMYHLDHEDGARAIDIGIGPFGVPIKPAQTGTVETVNRGCPDARDADSSCGGGFGNYVVVRYSQGVTALYTLYTHLSRDGLIADGSPVDLNSALGTIARSGHTEGDGTHLHFAIGTCARLWSTGPADRDTNCTIWNPQT